MPIFAYRFADGALDRLAAHHVAWQVVLYVLEYGHPSVREHIGAAVLRVTAADPNRELIMITLRERAGEDDVYEILSARYLDPEESAAASFLLTKEDDR